MSKTGSDSESGEEICGRHDTQRQDGRGADWGELQGGCFHHWAVTAVNSHQLRGENRHQVLQQNVLLNVMTWTPVDIGSCINNNTYITNIWHLAYCIFIPVCQLSRVPLTCLLHTWRAPTFLGWWSFRRIPLLWLNSLSSNLFQSVSTPESVNHDTSGAQPELWSSKLLWVFQCWENIRCTRSHVRTQSVLQGSP